MKQTQGDRRVVVFAPKPDALLAAVRGIAADSSKVLFSLHAQDRMEERGISTLDALRVLRDGEIQGGIDAGRSKGEWKCKIIRRMKGTREIGVVTVVSSAGRLYVKTVEWEDL